MNDFNTCFDRLIKNEGGFDDNPNDRGNWTTGIIGKGELKGSKYGISAMSYPDLDIRNMTEDQARSIYQRDFWQRAQMGQYPFAVAFQVFDAAVNSGIGNAVRFLQRAVGALDDGSVGAKTLAAVQAAELNDLLMRFNAHRLLFLTKTSGWASFGAGWANRIANNLLTASGDN